VYHSVKPVETKQIVGCGRIGPQKLTDGNRNAQPEAPSAISAAIRKAGRQAAMQAEPCHFVTVRQTIKGDVVSTGNIAVALMSRHDAVEGQQLWRRTRSSS
jgi:hypothetical protein